MQVTVDDLRRRYMSMPIEDLSALAREGALTVEADVVAREVLAARQAELESLPPDDPPPPVYLPSLPKVWPGYGIAAAFLFLELVFGSGEWGCLVIPLGMAGWFYWLWCVNRLHKVMAAVTHNRYPLTPGIATLYHFIPLYNLYWIFKWPSALAEYLNGQGMRQAMTPYVPGLLFLMFALVGGWVDGAIGTAGIFATLDYILRRVRPAVEVFQAVEEL